MQCKNHPDCHVQPAGKSEIPPRLTRTAGIPVLFCEWSLITGLLRIWDSSLTAWSLWPVVKGRTHRSTVIAGGPFAPEFFSAVFRCNSMWFCSGLIVIVNNINHQGSLMFSTNSYRMGTPVTVLTESSSSMRAEQWRIRHITMKNYTLPNTVCKVCQHFCSNNLALKIFLHLTKK